MDFLYIREIIIKNIETNDILVPSKSLKIIGPILHLKKKQVRA